MSTTPTTKGPRATSRERKVTVAMTGASGAQYGLRLIECLIQADYAVYLMFTKAAQIVVGSETDCALPGRTAEQTRFLSALYKAALVAELAGQRAKALNLMGRALAAGYPLREVRSEPDFAQLRADAAYLKLAARYQK